METKSLGFIGGGRIARIFLQAFANKKLNHGSVIVYDTNNEVLTLLKKQFPSIEIVDSVSTAAKQEIVFVALHPPMIMETLDKIVGSITNKTVVVSLAPKITIEKIASKLNTTKIVRMIPNATSFINEGYNPVTFASAFDEVEKQEVLGMLKLLGHTFEVAESKLEAYVLLSATLPTFFWFQWDELTKIGKQVGLSEEESKASVQQTMIAAINLMFQSGLSPNQVMNLIPVKPIGEHQDQITEIYQTKLMGLFEKIRP